MISENKLSDDTKINLIGLEREQLKTILSELGVKENHCRMRSEQIWNWIYVRGVSDFASMSNIGKDLRYKLSENCCVARPQILSEQIARDGTCKWLLRFNSPDGTQPCDVETVYIPDRKRGTLCISSQVGCTLNCSFCHTGTQKLVRNLTSNEIVAQIILAKERLGDFNSSDLNAGDNPDAKPGIKWQVEPPDSDNKVTNIVMMGMGEPLYNFDAVKTALLIANDDKGLAFSKRRITVSTAGVVPMIERCGQEIGVMLAISLHATTDDLRNELVPLNRKYPIDQLLNACRQYPGSSNTRRVTFEYVMLKDVNDSVVQARQLIKLLQGIPSKINLIPFNSWPGSDYQCSSGPRIEQFATVLNKAGYTALVRTPRGRDILAACGQLKSATTKTRKSAIIKASSAPAQT